MELTQDGQSVNQASFLTDIRLRVVREYIAPWKEFEAIRTAESASPPPYKEKDTTAKHSWA